MTNSTTLERIADICDVIAGQSPPSETYNQDGEGLPFYQGKADFGELYPKTRFWCNKPIKVALPNDILLSVRAPVGPTNISREKCCIGRGLTAIRCKKDADYKYVLYYFRKIRPILESKGKGSTFFAVTQDEIKELKIPLPPLPEQRRIAAILDKADEIRKKRTESIRLMDDLLKSAFLEMFGDPTSNPKQWRIDRMGSHLDFITSGSRGWAEYYAESGARFIRSLDVQMNEISDESKVFVKAPAGAEAERTRTRPNDVLLTITGSRIGRVAVVPENIKEAYVSQHVAILRLKEELRPDYAAMFLSLPFGGQRLIRKAQYGQTKPGLGLEQIRNFKIPCPPVEDQGRFTEIAEKFKNCMVKQVYLSQQSEDLFSSLILQAFRAG